MSTRRGPVVAVGDVDGDGDVDVTLAVKSGRVRVLLNDGTGMFGEMEVYRTAGIRKIEALAIGDANGDGALDLAVAGRDDSAVALLLNRGDGTFDRALATEIRKRPEAIVFGDFTNDGALDLVTANRKTDSISLLVNVNGTFPAGQVVTSPGGDNPIAVVAGDFTGDGRLDVVVVSDKFVPSLVPNGLR